jgi:hypothetical protein
MVKCSSFNYFVSFQWDEEFLPSKPSVSELVLFKMLDTEDPILLTNNKFTFF